MPYFTDEDYANQPQPAQRKPYPAIPAYCLKHSMTHDEVIAANIAAQSQFHAGQTVLIASTEVIGRVAGFAAGFVEVATKGGYLCFSPEWLVKVAES